MKKLIVILSVLFFTQAFAGDVAVTHTDVNVTTSSTVVTSRQNRLLLVLQNKSDTAISCNLAGAAAVVGEGIILNPRLNSGEAGTTIGFDVAVPSGPIRCIHGGTGNKVIQVTEG